MNAITVVGNLTRDPELRYVPSGAAVCKFGLAVNRSYTPAGGEKVEETTFFNVNCWRSLAENVAECLSVGHRVIVSGRMSSRVWEKEDGTKEKIWDLEAESVGPDLRWATAAITKTTRETPDAGTDWKAEVAG